MTNRTDTFQNLSKPLVWVCCALLVVIAGFSMVIDTSHAHFWVEKHVPAFWSFFGFVAAAVIIAVSSWIGRSGLQVREDHYQCCNEEKTCEEKK